MISFITLVVTTNNWSQANKELGVQVLSHQYAPAKMVLMATSATCAQLTTQLVQDITSACKFRT